MTAPRRITPSEEAAHLLALSLEFEQEHFQRATLLSLEQSIGFACALFLAFDKVGGKPCPQTSLVLEGVGQGYRDSFWRHSSTFGQELDPVRRFALTHGGTAVDTDVLGGRARHTRYYRELVEPRGGGQSLLCYLELRGAPVGLLMLGRESGRSFRDAEQQRVRQLRPALTLATASYGNAKHPELPAGITGEMLDLTGREQEIVDYLCRGYTNREIAVALGTSPHTVRNQLSALYAKASVTTRAELVGLWSRR